MNKLICSFVFFLVIIPCQSHAEIKTIYASHEYVMGDNDSRNDAQHICFLEAKRKVLEKAGTYISSHTVVKDMQLTKDEVNIYSAALLSVDTVEEESKVVGVSMTIKITVKAVVDTRTIEDQLSQINNDPEVQEKIKEQQGRLHNLERQVANLQRQMGSADVVESTKLRNISKEVLIKIGSLETQKIEIIKNIQAKSRNACKDVVEGMTPADVIKLLGRPDGEKFNEIDKDDTWYYGHTRIYFNDGAIVCKVECRAKGTTR